MLITKLVPQKRGSRFNVFIDGKFAFGVSTFVATKYKLSENTQLTDEEYLSIYKDEQTEYLKQKALDYLSARPRSEKEVRDKLKSKLSTPNTKYQTSKFKLGYSKNDVNNVEKTIPYSHSEGAKRPKNLIPKSHTKLPEPHQAGDLGSLNDQIINEVIKFLKKYDYVNDTKFAKWLVEQRQNQGKGPQFIKQDLYKKGVDKNVIQQVVSNIDSTKVIEQTYEKALKKYAKETNEYKKKQKIYRYLLSKGFSYDEINNLFN